MIKITLAMNGYTAQPLNAVGQAFAIANDNHAYGFTESVMTTDAALATVMDYVRNELAPLRALLLPSQAAVTTARIYLGGRGAAAVMSLNLPGPGGSPPDQVNVALLLSTATPGAVSQRRWWLHALPDAQVTWGEYRPSTVYQDALRAYLTSLEQKCYWNALLKNSLAQIFNITSGGLVTTQGAHTFQPGNIVTINRTYGPNGYVMGGKYMITSIGPQGSQFQLQNWPPVSAQGGEAYLETRQLASMGPQGTIAILRAGTRRVGRPLNLYRGRRSKRKGKASAAAPAATR